MTRSRGFTLTLVLSQNNDHFRCKKKLIARLAPHRINDGRISTEKKSNLFLSGVSNRTPHDSTLILGKADPDPNEENEKISCYEEGWCLSPPASA